MREAKKSLTFCSCRKVSKNKQEGSLGFLLAGSALIKIMDKLRAYESTTGRRASLKVSGWWGGNLPSKCAGSFLAQLVFQEIVFLELCIPLIVSAPPCLEERRVLPASAADEE